jgi:hypothetical protein
MSVFSNVYAFINVLLYVAAKRFAVIRSVPHGMEITSPLNSATPVSTSRPLAVFVHFLPFKSYLSIKLLLNSASRFKNDVLGNFDLEYTSSDSKTHFLGRKCVV